MLNLLCQHKRRTAQRYLSQLHPAQPQIPDAPASGLVCGYSFTAFMYGPAEICAGQVFNLKWLGVCYAIKTVTGVHRTIWGE